MTFATPIVLWLTLLPLALLAWEIAHRLRSVETAHPRILRAHAGARELQLLDPAAPAPHRRRPRVWLALGIIFAIAALARPQWGHVEEQVFNQAREILIAVDLSRSMLAEDVKPSRLGRAKLLIQSLLERLEGERVGLVLFSGTAFVQCPLSADYEILREFLPALAPDYLPEGGTNYGGLIDASVEAFASDDAADRFLIVLSDGEATDDDWQSKVGNLKDKNIRVVGLGIGTPDGAMIPDGNEGFVKDERGAVVMSRLGSDTLQKLAADTQGVYRDASTWVDLPALLRDTVETGRKGQFQETQRVRMIERFQWALAPAFFFLVLSFWLEFPARMRPRDLKLAARRGSPPPRSGATIAGALLLAAALVLGPHPARAAVKVGGNPPAGDTPAPAIDPDAPAVEPPAGPDPHVVSLTTAVTRLAGQSLRSAADWAELARLSIDYGEHFLTIKKPFSDGPIHDAIDAVDLGAALDAKVADWPELKRQLEDILRRRDEQNQEPPPPDQPPPPPPEKKPDQDQGGQQNPSGGDNDKKQDNSQQNSGSPPPKPDDQQKQDQQNQDQSKSANPTSNQEAFGDMKDQQPQPPPPADENTQKVGGNTEKKSDDPGNADPSLALPLQKLGQVRDKDSPAKLYQLMESQDHPPQKPQTKDW